MARIYFSNRETLNRLASKLDIFEAVNNQQGYCTALLRPHEYAALVQAGYRVEIDEAQTALVNKPPAALSAQSNGIPGFTCYRTVEETYASLSQLAADHPNLAAWIDIGDSWEKNKPEGAPGYDLNVLVLTNAARPGPKPKLFLIGAMHAREYATAELATRFAEYLVNNYGVDPDVTWLLDYFEVHIFPQGNPDGRKVAELGYYQRKNTDNDDGGSCAVLPTPSNHYGTDLNRNSSFKWDMGGVSYAPCDETFLGPGPASESEVKALQVYLASIFPDQRGPGDNDPAPAEAMGVLITLHSYGSFVFFPWGWTAADAPNRTALQTLGRKFGYFTDYQVCEPADCSYTASGATDDWSYGELGLASYTFELGAAFFESCSNFENTILPKNLPALLYAFKAARRPYQDPAGPESLQVTVAPTTTLAGAAVTLTATADDTRYNSNGWGIEPTQTITAARYTVDAPSWITGTLAYTLTAADGAFNAATENIQATIDTTGWTPGRHLIFVESQDAAGSWGVPSAVFLQVLSHRLFLPLLMR